MSKVLFSNNATALLAAGIAVGATSCTGGAGSGARFPSPSAPLGTFFFATFVSAADVNTKEIVRCTARTTDTFTISPTVNAWSAGDTFAILSPAEALEAFVQFDDLQAQAGNYALDTGAANAYLVTLTPTVGTPVPGMPIRWLAAHANTGPSTFNGSSLVLVDGSALAAGDIAAGGIYTSTWNTARGAYQLGGVTLTSFGQLSGLIQNNQVPESAVLQFLADILDNANLTGVPVAPTAAPGTNTAQVATTAFATAIANLAAAAAANPGALLANPGFQALFSGLIIQWGQKVTTANAGPVNVAFTEAFPHGVFVVLTDVIAPGGTGGAGSYAHNLTSQSAAGFVYSTTSASGAAITLNWFAIGW